MRLLSVYKSHKLYIPLFFFIKQHKNNTETMKNTTEEVVCFPYSAFSGCVSLLMTCRSSGLVLLRLPVRRVIGFVGRFLRFYPPVI